MAVVSFTSIHPKPGAKWEDTKKHLKKGCDLSRKHGAENVTALVGTAAGAATGTVILVYSCADWASYGKYQGAMMADPEMRDLMADPNSPIAGWDTYLNQTIEDI